MTPEGLFKSEKMQKTIKKIFFETLKSCQALEKMLEEKQRKFKQYLPLP